MDINLLVNICSRAWAMPILNAMATGTPGRQARLIAATGAGRTAFAQSMEHLLEMGLVERNPGHGHPLRPEFRLTDRGKKIGAMAKEIFAFMPDGEKELIRKSWVLPLISMLTMHQHFNDIARALYPITDRALSQTLKLVEEAGWVERSIEAGSRPPRSVYSLSERGRKIAIVICGVD